MQKNPLVKLSTLEQQTTLKNDLVFFYNYLHFE